MKKKSYNRYILFEKVRTKYWLLLMFFFLVSFAHAEGVDVPERQGRFLGSLEAKQQQKKVTVTGQVLDAKGEAIPGVSVLEKGTVNGTVTDIDGNYSINVDKEGAVLQFSFIGFVGQSVEVANQKTINVILESDMMGLDEVVVVGFGVQKKESVTAAVSSIKMDEVIGNRPVVSVTAALQGVTPGLEITQSTGQPGGEVKYNIRGVTSLNASGNQPLVIVNNVPMDINMVDPQDIETMSILKDVGSTAIYGARAAYGVILITTKQGKKNQKAQFSYRNNFSFSSPTALPQKASPLEEVLAYEKMGFNGGNIYDGRDIAQWKDYLLDYQKDPSKYPVEGYFYDDSNSLFWLKENQGFDAMMDDYGFQQNHNVSVSGGSASSNYYMSVGYTDEDGILITDKDSYKRFNTSMSYSADVNSWMSVKTDVRYAKSERSLVENGGRGGVWGNVMGMASWYSINDDFTDSEGVTYPFESSATYVKYGEPRTVDSRNLRLFGSVILNPIKNLKITGEYTFKNTRSLDNRYINRYEYYSKGLSGTAYSANNSSLERKSGFTDYNAINIYANYDLTVGDSHNFDFMVGYNQEESHYEQQISKKTDILIANLPSLKGASGPAIADDEFKEFSVRGSFFRVGYNYKDKYLFEAKGRYDGSSKFPTGTRFGFFPSFTAGWRVMEETFMKPLDNVMSNLKLRASWGEIGNQNIKPYMFVPKMEITTSNWLQDGVKPATFKSPPLVRSNFTWENVASVNFGIDLGFFKGRFNSTFDWYQRDTKGMLRAGSELPLTLGAPAPKENAADLRTTGWELSVNWNDKIGDFRYNLGFNIHDSQTEVTKYASDVRLLGKDQYGNLRYREGMVIGEIWGFKTLRLAQAEDINTDGTLVEGLYKFKDQGVVRAGDVLYENLDGDEYIGYGSKSELDSGDRRIIGNKSPRYRYGITGGLSWKNLDFSFILQGVGKRDYWREDQMMWPTGSWGANFKESLDFWSEDNTDAFFPRAYANDGKSTAYNQQIQTRYLANGAYLRVKNVTLSYTLPKSLLQNIHLDKVKFYVTGENLFTWDHLPEGMDAEMLSENAWKYPFMKKYSMGVNISF